MYHPDVGGVESITKQYAEWLSTNNYEVTVLTTYRKRTFKVEKCVINNVKIIRHSPILIIGPLPISIVYLFHYFILVKSHDIIHIHEPFPIGSFLGSLTFRKLIIVTFHSDIVKQKGILKFISVFFAKKSLKRARLITTTSERLLDSSFILSEFKFKTKILPLSSNTYTPTYSPHSDFLFIGRLSYYKGIEILLQAVEELKNLKRKIIVVGKGDKELEDLLIDYSLKYENIVFENKFLSEEEKHNYIKNCYCFLFPSTYNSEAFGITQVEALSHGKPVINTNLDTGVPWVSVNGLTGFTAEPNDVKSLAELILKMDQLSIKDYKNFCLNAKNRHQELFGNEKVKNKFLTFFNSLESG